MRSLLNLGCLQYSPTKAKAMLGLTGVQWREQTIEKLNDALLKWVEELPPHREYFIAPLLVLRY